MKTIKQYEIHVRRVKLAEDMAPYRRTFRSSADVASIGKSLLGHYDEERMLAVLLNGKLGFNGYSEVAKGGAGFVEIALPLVFRAAIYTSSPQLILIHNHPSGDSTPSREDVVFTNKVAEVGKILGIRILDHVIIGDGHFSFVDAGLMPSIT